MGKTYKDQSAWQGKREGKQSDEWRRKFPRVRIEKGGESVHTPLPDRKPKHKKLSRDAWQEEY